eukprot:Mycagemm_TRINITY_DN10041_c0_g1::TRINITY_DN10041_c0_g1_i1::g.2162::m.2162 type:complete len:141 gc:universal TRINITY_DN10041_c0_g1_i1:82-504(+)
MLGSTPPQAIVTLRQNLLSSSSLRIASIMWRGMMRTLLLSREAFPESSSTSAHMYSRTAARYTGAPAAIRRFDFKARYWRTRPTGNWRPARELLLLLRRACLPGAPPRSPTLLWYFVTALVPSLTACLASSPGRVRRTAV